MMMMMMIVDDDDGDGAMLVLVMIVVLLEVVVDYSALAVDFDFADAKQQTSSARTIDTYFLNLCSF